MKKLKLLAIITVAVIAVSCGTTAKRAVYTSLYGAQQAVVTSYDAYLERVVTGKIETNSVPLVSKRFNQFQAGYLIALDAAEFNTNALAPASLSIEAKDIVDLITFLTTKKP